ncbi:MAG: hypothetical protein AABM29_04185 [Actinomycetota bacterium]
MKDFQSPQFLADLYRDLRDRRLLSIAIALIAGVIVVPIALSNSSNPPPPPPAPAVDALATNPTAPAVSVVASNPGLRDYRRRLAALGAKDPFEQKFVAPKGLAGTELGATGLGASVPVPDTSSNSDASTVAPDTTGSRGGVAGGAQSSPKTVTKVKTKTETKYVSYKVKLRTGDVTGTLETLENVSTLDLLPSAAVPALAYVGVSENKALFMVSAEVSSITGQGACMLGTTTCQLMILKVGQYEDLVWIDGKTYRVKLLKIHKIVRNNPPS